ncbi:hypothetical protein JOB18_033835, partial [Solea senegalensis]
GYCPGELKGRAKRARGKSLPLIPISSNLWPHGSPAVRQPEEGASFPPLFLSSLLSLFLIWDTNRFAPRNHLGTP